VVIAFDHRTAGTDEDVWSRCAELAGLADLELPGTGARVVVVSAHPDDETLGAGGLIATLADRGVPVDVVVASNGEASHPDSPTYSPAELAARRKDEVRAAVACLAPGGDVVFLDLPDGRLARHVDDIASALGRLEPTHLVTPWQHDGHPDHQACAEAAARVGGARHWQYPIWAWHWGGPDVLPWPDLRRHRLDESAAKRKAAALDCHVSQHTPLSAAAGDEAILPPNVLAHFRRDSEAFVVDAPAAGAAYFDELYAHDADPWGLGSRFYEQRKRELVLAALPRPRFRRVFEPGCATGLLTRRLAARADEVVAWDGADAAVAAVAAGDAVSAIGGRVVVERRRIPDDWPDGSFDLVVLSEVGYYCRDLDLLALRARESLTDDGVLVACHWRRPAPDHPHTAEQVHRALGAGLHPLATHVEGDFLLDVWSVSGRSVAQDDGIVP